MRVNQGGSVLSFVVVGVVLSALALGAVFWASRQAETGDTAPLIVSENSTDSESSSSDNGEENASDRSQSDQEAEKKAAEEKQKAEQQKRERDAEKARQDAKAEEEARQAP